MILKFSTSTFLSLIFCYLGYVAFVSYKNNVSINLKKEIINFGVYLSILFIISMTLFPLDLNSIFNEFKVYNIVPFKVIFEMLATYSLVEVLYNIIGNIILFIPLGFFTYIKLNKNTEKALICIFLITLSIEILQAFIPVRFCEIDDLILNTLGGYIGIKLYSIFNK